MLTSSSLLMYFYYSDSLPRTTPQHLQTPNPVRNFRRTRQAEQVLLVSNGFAMLILAISAIILHSFPGASQTWADILGISLAIGACLQWLPQIITTWHLGHLGSLSPVALCLTTPYTWIFGISMIARVGTSGWSAWIVYVLVGLMQVVLLILAAVFTWWPSKEHQDQSTDDKAELLLNHHPSMSQTMPMYANERSPLLADQKSFGD